MSKQTDQQEQDLEYKMKYEKPLPVNMFNGELDKVYGEKINFGVYTTGKKVAERLFRQFVKPMKDQDTQT